MTNAIRRASLNSAPSREVKLFLFFRCFQPVIIVLQPLHSINFLPFSGGPIGLSKVGVDVVDNGFFIEGYCCRSRNNTARCQ